MPSATALVERAIQDQTIAQMQPMALNPVFGIDPKKWMKALLKAKRLDATDLQYTPEQQQKIDSTPPPDAPAVAAAKIVADTQLKLGVMKQGTDQQSTASEERIAQAANTLEGQRVQVDQQQTATDATIKLHELQTRHNLAMLEYANKRGLSLDRVKSDLAKTAMTLNTQKQLNAADNAVDLHKHQNPPRSPKKVHPQRSTPALTPPPTEAGPRAGNGRRFEQAPPNGAA